MFRPLIETLLNFDPFLVLAEYVDYLQCQERVSTTRRDQARRTRMSILNTVGAGKFSSDRSTLSTVSRSGRSLRSGSALERTMTSRRAVSHSNFAVFRTASRESEW